MPGRPDDVELYGPGPEEDPGEPSDADAISDGSNRTNGSFAGKGWNSRAEARLSLSEDGGMSVPGDQQPRGNIPNARGREILT